MLIRPRLLDLVSLSHQAIMLFSDRDILWRREAAEATANLGFHIVAEKVNGL
jgi:hypothetical protein